MIRQELASMYKIRQKDFIPANYASLCNEIVVQMNELKVYLIIALMVTGMDLRRFVL